MHVIIVLTFQQQSCRLGIVVLSSWWHHVCRAHRATQGTPVHFLTALRGLCWHPPCGESTTAMRFNPASLCLEGRSSVFVPTGLLPCKRWRHQVDSHMHAGVRLCSRRSCCQCKRSDDIMSSCMSSPKMMVKRHAKCFPQAGLVPGARVGMGDGGIGCFHTGAEVTLGDSFH